MDEKYSYLFPYEKISRGSKIIIYGAGDVGMEYLRQLEITNYCFIVGFVDRRYDTLHIRNHIVYSFESIKELEFDYIVLAFKLDDYAIDVKKKLEETGIDPNIIIYCGVREYDNSKANSYDEKESKRIIKDDDKIHIAVRYGQGLGDAIIKKKLINTILSWDNRIIIDIYSAKAKTIIPVIYGDCHRVYAIDDGAGAYIYNKSNYDTALSVFYLISVDYIDGNLSDKSVIVFNTFIKLKSAVDEYGLKAFPASSLSIHLNRMKYLGRNCYTQYNYIDEINIKDCKVYIPLKEELYDDYLHMELQQYITINYGVGAIDTHAINVSTKLWPLEYYEELLKLFKEQFPNIEVVQVGSKDSIPVRGADRYEFGRDLELVKHILANSIFHFDIEGGLMHLATQLGTKCVVVYGPTPVWMYGYSQNINIVSSKCKDCYAIYNQRWKCARGMEKPECMYSILPELVMDEIRNKIFNGKHIDY